jgi:hypothetical protein
MAPTVGRIVHYHLNTGEEEAETQVIAAIVTRVINATTVSLRLFQDCDSTSPNFIGEHILLSKQGSDNGEWNWPPKVEESVVK